MVKQAMVSYEEPVLKSFILKLARDTIENYVKTGNKIAKPANYPLELEEKRGIFVTIYKKPRDLRGCIGLPFPDKPLIVGIIEASVQVCNDHRFPPLSVEELKDITVEVSILSKPEEIKYGSDDIKNHIKIGKDGLIIRKDIMGGLFLPQVPVEQDWNIDEYLENLCYKAGLGPNEWMDEESVLYKFQTEILSEK